MEDAHTTLLSIPGDKEASYFGVFDGHGGMRKGSAVVPV